MFKRIIHCLKSFRRKFKKLYNTLRTCPPQDLAEVLTKIFRKFQRRTAGFEGKSFLNLLETTVLPAFWLKLGKNVLYQLKEYFYFLIFLSSLSITPEGGSQMLELAAILGPNADTLLHHLAKFTTAEILALTDQINAVILRLAQRHFRRGFWKKAFPVAIDCTDNPFYGDRTTPGIVGGKKKGGTNWFYRFAALTLIQPHLRFTLAEYPVLPLENLVEVVRKLISKAEAVIRIKEIEVDRGFFNTKIVQFLTEGHYKFLMPAVKNTPIKEAIHAYHQGTGPSCFAYQFKAAKAGEGNKPFTVFLVKGDQKEAPRRKNAQKPPDPVDLYHVFATNKKVRNHAPQALQRLADQYRARWGIETGFKMVNLFHIKTTSTNFVIRLFFQLFAVVLYNLWILLNLLQQSKHQIGYILPTPRVKMLLLLKSLQILASKLEEKWKKPQSAADF